MSLCGESVNFSSACSLLLLNCKNSHYVRLSTFLNVSFFFQDEVNQSIHLSLWLQLVSLYFPFRYKSVALRFIGLRCVVLSYVALLCIVLRFIVLNCVVLCCVACVAFCCVAFHCVSLCSVAWQSVALCWIALHCVGLCSVALRCVALFCVSLCWIVLRCFALLVLCCVVSLRFAMHCDCMDCIACDPSMDHHIGISIRGMCNMAPNMASNISSNIASNIAFNMAFMWSQIRPCIQYSLWHPL